MLSEDDVRHVMQMYNNSIDQCTMQNEELRHEICSLQSQMRAEE